jgi:hypothetical protein
MFGLPEYYQRNAGTIYIADRNLATGGAAATGLEFIGDASELTLDPSQEFVEHMEHQSGDGKKDVRIPRMTTLAGSLVLDNTGAANFKRFLRGKLTAIGGATVTGEDHTAPAAGKSFLLEKNPAATPALTITPDPSGTAFTAGTDYVQEGRVIYVPTGSTMAGDPILAAYTAAASTQVDLFGENFKEYYLYFQGFNTVNRKAVTLELFKVSFDPAALGNLLGDEITQMTIAFEALFEPLKSSGNLQGYGNYVSVD